MKSFLFRLRFSWKNITRNPGRSLVVFLTLTLSMTLTILILGMNNGFSQIFYHQLQDPYLNVDMTLTYDSNSESRILNKRGLTERYSAYYRFAACFFNYYSLIGSGDDPGYYAQVFSGAVIDLENLIDTDLGVLNDGEMFVTRSMADKHGLSENDTVRLYVSGSEVPYRIKAILPDRGLFAGEAVFVNKVELLQRLFSLSGLSNLGNIVYIDLIDPAQADTVSGLLSEDPDYSGFVAAPTADPLVIKMITKNTSALFIGVGGITLIAVLVVLNSVFPLLFQDFRQQIGIIKTLGGDHRFSLSIWLTQFLLMSMGAVPLGIYLAWAVFNQGAAILGIQSVIRLGGAVVLVSLAAYLLFVGGEVLIRFRRLIRQSGVALTYDHRHEWVRGGFIVLGVSGILFVVQKLTEAFSEPVNALLSMIFGIVFCFTLCDFLASMIGAGLSRKKQKSLFGLFGAQNLRSNKIVRSSLRVAMISIVVIALNLTVRSFIEADSMTLKNNVLADYFLTNIVDDPVAVQTQISAEYDVEAMQDAIIYRYISMDLSQDETPRRRRAVFFISLPPENMDAFFDYEFDSGVLEKLADTQTPYITVSEGVGKIYGLKVGDEVVVELGRDNPQMTFIIAGFIHTNYHGIVFSNLYRLEAFANAGMANTVIIKNGDDETLKPGLMAKYNARLYYLVDFEELFAEGMDEIFLVMDFMSLLAYSIVIGFVIVIINNSLLLFYSLKNDYAKLKILGLSPTGLAGQLGREVLSITIIAAFCSFLALCVLIPHLGPLMLFATFYKTIPWDALSTGWRTLAAAGVLIFSYAFYLHRVLRLDPITEIKTY